MDKIIGIVFPPLSLDRVGVRISLKKKKKMGEKSEEYYCLFIRLVFFFYKLITFLSINLASSIFLWDNKKAG